MGNGADTGLETAFQQEITFLLDGERITLDTVSPETLLIDYLHSLAVNKSGTKLVCGEGGCGACTVMLTSWDRHRQCLVKRAINSCLRPLCSIDGMAVTTTQGLGSIKTELDPTQHAIAANNGSQCGFCTPGFVMSMYTELQKNPNPTEQNIEDLFDGHICRCTGFRPILEGFRKEFASDYQPPPDPPEICIDPNYTAPVKDYSVYEPPADFREYMKDPRPIALEANGYVYFRPLTIGQVYELKARYGDPGTNFKLLGGNTSVGIVKTRPLYAERTLDPRVLVDVAEIPELLRTEIGDHGLIVGGSVSLARLQDLLEEAIATRHEAKTRGLVALRNHLEVVANVQVRNVGSLAGNISMAVNLGFLSDLLVVLGALGARVVVGSSRGDTTHDVLELPVDSELPTDAVYLEFHIPFSTDRDYVNSYKVRRRFQNAHALVNCAFNVRINGDGCAEASRLVFNGVRANYAADAAIGGNTPFHPIRATHTEGLLAGAPWTAETLERALDCLDQELEAYRPPDGPAGPLEIDETPWSYRKSLALNLFYKYFVYAALEVHPGQIPDEIRKAGERQRRPISRGSQVYNDYPDELPVSKPLVKLSAFMQAAGEAKYSHDEEPLAGTLEAAYVYSLVARGTFGYRLADGHEVDGKGLAEHLRQVFPDFVDYVCYEDIPVPAGNWTGPGVDDPIFVPNRGDEIPDSVKHKADQKGNTTFFPDQILCVGAPLGLVVANSRPAALKIADYVRTQCIEFEAREALTDFQQAIAEKHFFPQHPVSNPGLTHVESITRPGSNQDWIDDPDTSWKAEGRRVRTVKGSQRNGFQNHFYLETMATLAVPGENKAITLRTSTQTLADNQSAAAGVLGVSANNVRVIVRRQGGAFGGKQTLSRFNSTAAAVAAVKLNRPVRLILDRNTNFIMCGERHPYQGDYHVAFDDSGKIHGLSFDFYSNGGQSYDVSFFVMDLSVESADGVYKADTFHINGNVCQTNLITNTAFRTFGIIQTVNILEEAIERVAHEVGVAPEEIRERNFYKRGGYEWTGFEITEQTLAVLGAYDFFDQEILEQLATLKGKRFDGSDPIQNKKDFEDAVNKACPFVFDGPFNLENIIMLEEFSNTAYDFTPYMQGLKYLDIQSVWSSLKESSEFELRQRKVERFNAENRWIKRGISMVPLRYGVSYNGPRGTLNQGGAYVLAYSNDGSVLVQHGGVENGQGIQTKMAQIAAATLDIPFENIRMADNDTQVISDASSTAASTGSDLNGGAVQEACLELRTRLEKFCEDLEQNSDFFVHFDHADQETKIQIDTVVRNWRERWSDVWPLVVSLAYTNRINLAAQARYKTPHYISVDVNHPFGHPFFYFVYAAAVSEVEIDVLTGDYTILRTDILYDTGKSLNPLIDIGQIEGAFVQGVGYVTLEEMTYQTEREVPRQGYPDGAMTTVGTWGYKPPESKSIPLDFRVQLVNKEGEEPHHKGPKLANTAIRSSKGIGEPPMVLANSVFYAIKHAILAARRDAGHDEWFALDAPATVQRIQSACAVTRDRLRL